VEAARLWQVMKWDPAWSGEAPRTPLLAAAILLQWSEGVELCVRRGADVNDTYCGPFRCADGSVGGGDATGVPMLRVALSVRGPAQCTICQHVLAGKVRGRTFQSIRKRAKAEMEPITASFLDRFTGPLLTGG